MVLKDILAISGESGLFRFIAQGKNAIIVEHLETKKRSSVYGSAKVSSLEDIAIFTESEDMPLSKVFDLISMKQNGGAAIDSKSDNNVLKNWFSEILPEYDRDRVYVSDIKKIVMWYNILHRLDLLIKEEPEVAKEDIAEAEKSSDEPVKAKTTKKKSSAAAKKKS